MEKLEKDFPRRSFLSGTLSTVGLVSMGSSIASIATANPWLDYETLKAFGPLQRPNQDRIMLPKGFSSRKVAEV